MDRLPFPGGRTAGSEVGHVRVAVQIGNRAGGRFQPIEALVDTGATYSWVPRDVLERLAVVPEDEWPFVLADGREVRYPVAWINIRLGARAQPTIVVFGDQGSEPILGVVTLEEFRLAVDPVNHRLISVPGRLGAAVVSLSLTRSEHACHPERRRREGSALLTRAKLSGGAAYPRMASTRRVMPAKRTGVNVSPRWTVRMSA